MVAWSFLMNQSQWINPYLAVRSKPIKTLAPPTTQSGPGSQTAPHQARNTASGCNAAPSLHRSTGFAV